MVVIDSFFTMSCDQHFMWIPLVSITFLKCVWHYSLLSFRFVLYFCTLCHDANQGINSLNVAMDSLLTLPKSLHSESSTIVHSENSAEVKPTVLWKALYIQELTMVIFSSELFHFQTLFCTIMMLQLYTESALLLPPSTTQKKSQTPNQFETLFLITLWEDAA